MDSSTKLKFLQGNLKLRAEDVDPAIWSSLVFGCIKESKPHFKYFSNQHPLGEMLNCHLPDYDQRITPIEITVFPPGISAKTKCMEIIQLDSEYIKKKEFPALKGLYSGHPGWEFIIEKRILLSNSGNLLLWIAKYRPQQESGLGFSHNHTGTNYKAETASFEKLTMQKLTELLKNEKNGLHEGYEIISTLLCFVINDINTREKHLSSMRTLRDGYKEILHRIEF